MESGQVTKFRKVLSAWDILVISLGAMIGWGWVVSTGDWLVKGGIAGTVMGFAVGGLMVFFVGLTYAELMSMMPQSGGEHVFSHRALGALGSFACTWAIILGYASIACFEACALPTIVTYLYPRFLWGYLYTIAGFDIYASWLGIGILTAALVTYVNIRGVRTAAIVQTVLMLAVVGVGMLLVGASVFSGDTANLYVQIWSENIGMIESIVSVAVLTPFFFIGFDVIPQTAEEVDLSPEKMGRVLVFAVIAATTFYAMVAVSVGYVLSPEEIEVARHESGLVTAEAMAKAFSSHDMAKVLIFGGICGIVTSWNAFLLGGSRALYAMGKSSMVPECFARLHPQYGTPTMALVLLGMLTMIAPFFGRKMLVWVVDAGNFGCCLAYCIVAVSFLILRKREPEASRPYKVKHYRTVGVLAFLMAAFMISMYVVPWSLAALCWQEWLIVGIWIILGITFGVIGKLKYKQKFGVFQKQPFDV